MFNFLGRYTAVIFTTVLFVILVVSVLGVNFTLSFQTEANAEVVNLAGRQRMLSQRVAKSLANVRARYVDNKDFQDQLTELNAASGVFNKTIFAFKNGGVTVSTKGGDTVLNAVTDPAELNTVDSALKLWNPLYKSITELINELSVDESESIEFTNETLAKLNSTQEYLDLNINSVLKLMNDLTNFAETQANDSANQSRLIQTIGIIASLICFAVILYLIFGQLQTADRSAEAARQETQQIFQTVDQGLFLLDRDMKMGNQHSKALELIFSDKELSNVSLQEFLGSIVSSEDLDKVERYLKLLFDPHKKERLLRDLNPLNKLSVQIKNNGQIQDKFLSFAFSRVLHDGQIVRILSSVTDITKEVQLGVKLEEETIRNEQQLEMISSLMSIDTDLLPEFLNSSNVTYSKINDLLKTPSRSAADFQEKADSMLALIHRVKGDSSALGLDLISNSCHEFESKVENLLTNPDLTGDEFISIAVMLDQMISTNERISSVFNAVIGNSNSASKQQVSDTDNTVNLKLYKLAQEIAERQQKQIELSLAGFESGTIAKTTKMDIVSLASQLLRNAIAHGIETSPERNEKGKSENGKITLALYDQGDQGLSLVCEDDGRGINFKELTSRALEKGLINEQESQNITANRILNLLLSNRLSSNDDVDQDSGRGVGLSVVKDLCNKLNAKISLQTKAENGTRFTIRFPHEHTQILSEAS